QGRVPPSEGSLAHFEVTKTGPYIETSYESPQSERQTLLKRLAEFESDLAELTKPETEATEQPEAEPEQEAKPDVDIEAVRRAATERAIADGERWAQEQEELRPQQDFAALKAELRGDFDRRMQQLTSSLTPDDRKGLERQLRENASRPATH